jgi:ribosome maturation protein SDO1
MGNVIARIKANGKNFEILVDVDKALKFRKGEGRYNLNEVVAIDRIFSDSKKGEHASEKDMQTAFGTTEVYTIVEKIIKNGEIQIPQEYRDKQKSEKVKQVVDFIVRNAVDPRTNRPYTAERIEKSIEDAGINIQNKPIEMQIKDIIEKLSRIIPIKIETKKVLITIPARYTGQVYGLIQNYKESEEWLSNGDLKCILKIPAGSQIEFYDKLNAMTHGSVISEEQKE